MGNNPPQNGNDNSHTTLSEFMRTTPPIFTETTEPLDADDWIHTIEDLLALVKCTDDHEKVLYASHYIGGTTRAWWDGFQIMRAGQVMTWAMFKEGFRAAHIPPGMMTIKKREFRALRQEDVNTEAAKVECFMEGLEQSLQYQLVVCQCRTFCDLVNKDLMLEDKRRATDDTRKRKLMGTGEPSNPNPRPWESAPARPSYQQQQYKAPMFSRTTNLSSKSTASHHSTHRTTLESRPTFQDKLHPVFTSLLM
ncbi:hypothetical protein D1007_62394 [Hordeum vulgare]|nr:hypothetical protein D1007_62394 [Hordeum vulgare]